MSRTIRKSSSTIQDGAKGQRGRRKRDREVALRVVRRREPDLRRMGRALIALALREAAAEAEAAQQAAKTGPANDDSSPGEKSGRVD
jgi:hypothetical protein